ncbi:hypothetical protein, partial [Klebsiella pneumoniae]|uniref:hypothetical protein n=1 Tax=Klebsiella pneumoniae TaxID=573 RepID=UPI00370FE7C7
VLAILICTRIKTTDPYKWRANYDCTINTGCHPSTEQWVQGDSCGILYGLNGVCHQAANRILAASNGQAPLDLANTVAVEPFPTGILSWLTYGPLGWDIDEFWALVQVLYAGSPAASVQEAEARLIQLHFARSTDVALRRPIIARF